MKLSILMPTHNRPKLFSRALTSILLQIVPDVEVIVNNDSCDITEVPHPQVKYFYNKFEHLSGVYQFLVEQSKGEYVYFLEDDDYVTAGLTTMELRGDLIAGNYMPMYDYARNILVKCMSLYKPGSPSYDDFIRHTDWLHLQLGQFIFKRTCIDGFPYPPNSNIHNDELLVRFAAANAKRITTTSRVLYYQTIDGGDNISFNLQKNS